MSMIVLGYYYLIRSIYAMLQIQQTCSSGRHIIQHVHVSCRQQARSFCGIFIIVNIYQHICHLLVNYVVAQASSTSKQVIKHSIMPINLPQRCNPSWHLWLAAINGWQLIELRRLGMPPFSPLALRLLRVRF